MDRLFDETTYFIYEHWIPVKFVPGDDGLDVLRYNETTDKFEREIHYVNKLFDHSLFEQVTKEEFDKLIAELKEEQ